MNKKTTGTATIRDVAEQAGVSLATVSRVFNKKGNVQEETFNKIVEAARALGYRTEELPLFSDASVKTEGNDLIVFNVPYLSNPFYSEIIKGAISSAKAYQFDLLVSEQLINEGNVKRVADMYRRVNAKGVITMNLMQPNVLKALDDAIPVVQCGEYVQSDRISAVSIDDYAATKRVIEHLLSMGKTRIALINSPLEFKYARERRRGYIDTLRENGMEVNPAWMMQLDEIDAEKAFSAAVKLFSDKNMPDAIFAVSDVFAAGVLRATKFANLSIPQDVAIVGFDNLDFTSMMIPSITSVRQPRMQMGYLAGELLIERIRNPKAEAKTILLDTELIIRESSLA